MVMRTIEIREISYKVGKKDKPKILARLKELYGKELKISSKNDEIRVEGDLHNYKRRERIIWILSGGKHGSDLQTN